MTTKRHFLPQALPAALLVALLAALLAGGLASCARPEQQLSISNAWVRLTPQGSPMTAGYGTFSNTGSQAITLSRFSSPQFGDITLHYTEDVNGTATMREARNHTLAPGDSLTLAPGGYHLMLMQRLQETPEGTNVELTFELESGATSKHTFTVARQ